MKNNRIRQEAVIDKSNFSQAESELPTSLGSLPGTICETTLGQTLSQSLKSQNANPSTNLNGAVTNSASQNGGNINCNQLRAGDWVCLLCNNLNFSFRSECNRCLVQTKKKNFFQNMMLVQDGQSSSQQQVNDINAEISSSHQEDSKNQIGLTGNAAQHDEPKLHETPLKYERYASSKAGCGFENVLLLLTPHRNNLHSDDDAEHRVSAATTAPLSSHSGSDPDQPNDTKHSEKGMFVDSDINRIQIPFEEDEIFGRDNQCKKISAEATALQFSSSPEDQKGKRTGVVGEQANKGESLIEENCNSKQGQFQLFGQANTEFPHFMSSPSSMHDDDEEQEDDTQKETKELRQFDNEESDSSSGSFQNEIQQQINNIIMDEEECKNTGVTHNDDKPDATFRLASTSLNPNDKPSFSFGGIFGQLPGHATHSLNQIKESGIQPFSDSQRNICQSLNFNQVGGQTFSLNNNNNNSCGGVNFQNYSQFVTSNHFSDSHPSALQQGQQAAQQQQQNFQIQSIFQGSEHHFFNSKGINAQSKMNNSQNNLKDQTSANVEQNNGFIFDNGGSNTFIPVSNPNRNVFSKLAQYDNFYQQENLFNQNTINFEQASVFAGKPHQIEEISQEENEEYTEGDNEEELGEQSLNSGVRSAKKSNNIRKKRKNQGSENKKKPNKFALAIHQHHSFHHNSLQQLNLHPHVNSIHGSTSSQPVPEVAAKESESQSYGGMQSQAGNQGPSNNPAGNPKKQDWICPRCANLNYSFRKLCNKCQFAKNSFAIHISHAQQTLMQSQQQQFQQQQLLQQQSCN